MMIKLKVRKGDEVIVITGKDKGKIGKVKKVLPQESQVLVSGINMVKKHTKPTRDHDGGILSKEMPIHISNIAHVDPKTGRATKVAIKTLDDGSKVRVSKASGEVIVAREGN